MLKYHAEYCTKLIEALIHLSKGDLKLAQQAWCCFMQYIRTQEASYQPYLDVYRVIEVATNYTGVSLDIPI